MRRLYALFTLLPALAVIAPAPSHAQIISITIAPPVLPVYVQPAIPAPGYMWTPGYWAYGPDGYFWVPGTWVQPPSVGLLWTPGYWGWNNGVYAWNAGYWGPTIGFYGGVSYGFGYGGVGFEGGVWRGGVFSYNRSVTNFGSVNITNVYNKTVIVNPGASRVAFNGGAGGIAARPTPQEEAAMHEQHIPATAAQTQHEHTASTTRENLASVNHGAPAVAATARPGEFSGKGVVGAHGAATPARAAAATPGGGLARGPGSANPLGSPAAPRAAGTPNAAPKAPANTLATGSTPPNRELRPANPATGAPAANARPPGPVGGAPAAGAPPHPAATAAAPHPVAAAPRAPAAAPRAPAGGGRPAPNHRPG